MSRVTPVFDLEEIASATEPTVLSIRWPGGTPVLAKSLAEAAAN